MSESNPMLAGQPPSVKPGEALLLIERMGVKYDGQEDRIAIDIANREGTMARLWLTRHGADILVRATSAKIEAYATTRMAGANVPPDVAGPLRESALATEQLTARLTQRSVSALELPPGTPEHLVTGVAMPPHPGRIQLDFMCKPQLKASVRLQSAEMLQWLSALQRQYQKAGWGGEVWPTWLKQRANI